MDQEGENLGFQADTSITCQQLKPARKHLDEVLKRLDLVHSESKRMAHLRHTFFARFVRWNWFGKLILDHHPSIERAPCATALADLNQVVVGSQTFANAL